MNNSTQIKDWISEDSMRMQALFTARSLGLSDWCLAAGFVRNLAWDKVHGYSRATALNDIDLIYFDPDKASEEADKDLESRLKAVSDFPWSVKNQARMHKRNSDSPYASTEEAMSYWVEVETAVGATLSESNEIEIVAPFGIDVLFEYTITPNPKRPKPEVFAQRVQEKRWLKIWPNLVVNV
ncbi:MAG TPA: nucleotidyltransferase family protein [Alcanivorax sp.]|nr:nucleotidyltransferase family protein [Alcanivorax sp.]